jgi:hypothetical protein
MKMKKIISVLMGSALYIIAMVLLTGYGNLRNHPSITKEVVDKFRSLNNKGIYSMPKFKNCFFDFDYFLPCENYVSSVMFYNKLRTERTTHMVRDWIERGSLTADVPEVQASVRHFYDPTVPPAERYLQDIAIGPIMSYAQEVYPNPTLNDLDWAIYGDLTMPANDPTNHKFCWTNGKKWVAEAMEAKDAKTKDSLMGLAWRALGETLHMIEDHGHPAHVRDDSHPAPRGYGNFYGDPDTYEEFMCDIFPDNIALFAASGKIDANLKSSIADLTTVRDIAHTLAVWTNKNFFTNQTISGTNHLDNQIKQIAHPAKEYASPKISMDGYDPTSKYYMGTVGGHSVKMCFNYLSFYELLWQGKKKVTLFLTTNVLNLKQKF